MSPYKIFEGNGFALKSFLAVGLVAQASAAPVTSPARTAASARLTVDISKPGAKISPLLYGAFFEEISRAGDGGIYAEMLQNRSFEDTDFPLAWTLIKGQDSAASIALDKSAPLNSLNPTSLKLTIPEDGVRVGVANNGFAGAPQRGRKDEWMPAFDRAKGSVAVQKGKRYDLSLYARASHGFAGPLVASLES